MERKINDVFNIRNSKIKCIEDINKKGCKSCYFNFNCFNSFSNIGFCTSGNRIDGKEIIFIKIN